jgi:NIMA (never in mitosis gene a)-related kinase
MKSLYHKVTKGVFPNIPSNYSGELYFLISKMLTVEASLRPSAEDLLDMPVVAARAAELAPS